MLNSLNIKKNPIAIGIIPSGCFDTFMKQIACKTAQISINDKVIVELATTIMYKICHFPVI